MLFHTPGFALFFLVFIAGVRLIPNAYLVQFVCLASYFFYAWWYPPYLVLLLGLTLFGYFSARFSVCDRRPPLTLLVLIGLLPLVFYKYSGFALSNFSLLFGWTAPEAPKWTLPLGISFISFTIIAYVIDSYRGKYRPETSFWNVALYISFFPHLIAGPIMRAGELMPQFQRLKLIVPRLVPALVLFTVGAIKKVGVADQLAPISERVFSNSPLDPSQGEAWLAFYAFTIQIYCDFSGYTDMAIALAWLVNIDFPINFDRPYLAGSLREFWRRWHMTLSRWLRDYLYFTLGGSRQSQGRTFAAILVTMILGGLWHGAAWTFVLWGALHGGLIVLEHAGERVNFRAGMLPLWLRQALVFHLVAAAWVIFRAQDVNRALSVFQAMATPGSWSELAHWPLAIILISLTMLLHKFDNPDQLRSLAMRLPNSVTLPAVSAILALLMALSVDNPSAFIYFDF